MMDKIRESLGDIGEWFLFVRDVSVLFFRKGIQKRELVDQMYQVGVRSFAMTCISGLFVGAILALQINLQLKDFGAQVFLGGLSTSTTLRNLGPVLIAFLLAGRVGAFSTAELGTMAITDQLNAIRCLGLNPLSVIVVPRLVALIISSFFLLVLGLALTVCGGILISVLYLKINVFQFSAHIPQFVSKTSIFIGVLKSFVFGSLIGSVSCFIGFNTTGGAEDVGRAVRRTAVVTLLSILVMDFTVSFCVEACGKIFGS